MSTRSVTLTISTLAVGLAASAGAQKVIFNTFGPGDSYDAGSVVYVRNVEEIATEFTVSQTVDLASIDLALGASHYSIYLSTGIIPGSTLGTSFGTVLDSWDAYESTGGVSELTPNKLDKLKPGTYDVVATIYGNTRGGWFLNNIGSKSPWLGAFLEVGPTLVIGGGTTPAMKVEATPESTPLAVLALGVLGLFVRRKRDCRPSPA
jgi:hypothetical protein